MSHSLEVSNKYGIDFFGEHNVMLDGHRSQVHPYCFCCVCSEYVLMNMLRELCVTLGPGSSRARKEVAKVSQLRRERSLQSFHGCKNLIFFSSFFSRFASFTFRFCFFCFLFSFWFVLVSRRLQRERFSFRSRQTFLFSQVGDSNP